VRGFTLNYAAPQLVNFDIIRTMILGGDPGDVITVRTKRKIKGKLIKCGPPLADPVRVVSEPGKLY
jgi:hypothetical protein